MGFLPEIDEAAVLKAVSDFFLQDGPQHPVNYATIERRANAIIGLTGQGNDVNAGFSGSSKGNSAENRVISNDMYWRAKLAVEASINACSEQSAQILKYRYIKQLKVWQVRSLVNIDGNGSYQRADRHARYEFADVIELVKDRYSIPDTIIPDFYATAK